MVGDGLKQTLHRIVDAWQPLAENATLTVESPEGGVWWTIIDAAPCSYNEVTNQLRRGDGVDSEVLVRRSVLPDPLPDVNRVCRVFIEQGGVQRGPFKVLLWLKDDPLGLMYRLELDEQQRGRYG